MDAETRSALHGKANRAALERLQDQVKLLSQKLAAVADGVVAVNAKTQRFGATLTDFAGGAGTVDVTVTWPTPWPDTAYGVWPKEITGAGATGKVFPSLKPSSKTPTSCVVTVVATQAVASCGLDVLGVRT